MVKRVCSPGAFSGSLRAWMGRRCFLVRCPVHPILPVLCAAVLGACSLMAQTPETGFDPVRDFSPEPVPFPLGAHIQDTLGRLASSTPELRREVRIAYYGQSITQPAWTDVVTAALRERYPHARIVAENLAIGGFAAERLRKTTPGDLFPFRPDLVILHVYGGEPDYEALVNLVRTGTGAEMVLMSDHATWTPEPGFQYEPRVLGGLRWHEQHRFWLAELGRRERLGFVDITAGFRTYGRERGIDLKSLTTDGTHLNDEGSRLMAGLVLGALVRDEAQPDGVVPGMRERIEVGAGAWRDGVLEVAFEGRRVDAVLVGQRAGVDVQVDGLRPTAIPEARVHSRTRLRGIGREIPPLFRVRAESTPELQAWTLEITEAFGEKGPYAFRVSGSVTGADGVGRTDEPFVSPSGQVLIEPGDWNLEYAGWANRREPGPGYTVRWDTVSLAMDRVEPDAACGPADERRVTLAQQLRPGRHVVRLRCADPAAAGLVAFEVRR